MIKTPATHTREEGGSRRVPVPTVQVSVPGSSLLVAYLLYGLLIATVLVDVGKRKMTVDDLPPPSL